MRAMPDKDPNATLDYTFDWTAWLAAVSDAIVSYSVAIDSPPDAVLTKDSDSRSGNVITAWLSGGTVGQTYTVRCRINTTGGRIDDRSFSLTISER